jgi:hypothetical protein
MACAAQPGEVRAKMRGQVSSVNPLSKKLKRRNKMAKRKMLFHPDHVREKIRASQLINRLQAHELLITTEEVLRLLVASAH